MEIDRKDTNIQIGKRLREARTNMNKDKAEFAATLDVTEEHYRKLEAGATGLSADKILIWEGRKVKKIYAWEPWFFMFFGLFHLHRIWGLIDRTSYADFWIGILESKGIFYFVLMGILAFLCVCGIATSCKNIKNNYWWRWIYIFGGSYVLFDLFAIAIELKVWNDLLLFMFDVNSQYWNIVWGFFIILGAFVFYLGTKLLKLRKEQI